MCIEVPVEPNRLVKKGELLFRIDPTPYQNELNIAKAKLAVDEAKFAQSGANLADASAGARELREQLKSASGQVACAAAAGSSSHDCGCDRIASWWRLARETGLRWSRPKRT